MNQSPKIVTIFGGSGFVGRYVARRMAKAGWRVLIAVRRPNEAHFVRPYGVVGQVEPILANVRDDASVRAALAGSDAVVNCVSVLQESGKQTFEALNDAGAGRVAKIAAEEGIDTFVHLSALGADLNSNSDSARTKAEGEQAVLSAFPNAMILRPSVIFGNEDQFFNRFADLTKLSPVLPIVGGNSLFQPVYVDDVAQAVCQGITNKDTGGIYELGGPDVDTLTAFIQKMLKVIRRRRLVINLPFIIGSIMGGFLGLIQFFTLGLFTNTILTRDQVKQLRKDNLVSDGSKSFTDLDITPTGVDAVIEEYLYQYRPYGQYSELTESAKNLKGTPSDNDF